MKNSPGLPIRVSLNQDAGPTTDTHTHTPSSASVVFAGTHKPVRSSPALACAARDQGGVGSPDLLKTDGLQPFHLFTLMVCDLTFAVRDRESSWLELVRPPAGRTLPRRPPRRSPRRQGSRKKLQPSYWTLTNTRNYFGPRGRQTSV